MRKGLTQKDMADILHVNVATVSFWETGKYAPGVRRIPKIAKLLDITADDILSMSNRSDDG